MSSIFSHRGNLYGPDVRLENTTTIVGRALELGFGLETDIRRDVHGELYISHDRARAVAENYASLHVGLWLKHPNCQIALNVKEIDWIEELVNFVGVNQLHSQTFLFDFELVEEIPGSTAAKIHSMDSEIRLAARVSDRYGESILQAESIMSASIIWLDEFDSLWVTEADVRRMKQAGRTIYAISPEIHGYTVQQMETRWRQFQAWGVDGICTDYPIRAREVLGAKNGEAKWLERKSQRDAGK